MLHLFRVFFTGAYRKPRELTYWLGVTMLTLSLFEAYLGYSLVDDLMSGMGLVIGYSVGLSIPFVGQNLMNWLFDGMFPGSPKLWPRMYIAHVLIFPILIGLLLGAHLLLVAMRHHTQFRQKRAQTERDDRRRARVAGAGAALAGADGRDGRLPLPARRARPDQPDLALGAVPHVLVDERRAAGLVPRLADRRAAARAELRPDDRPLHARAEPVLGRRRVPADRLRVPLPLAVARASVQRGLEFHNLLDRPRDAPVRTAIGVAMVSWVFLVFMAGSADRVNVTFGIAYTSQIWVYRVIVWVLPVLFGFATWWICRELQAGEVVLRDRHEAEAEAKLARMRRAQEPPAIRARSSPRQRPVAATARGGNESSTAVRQEPWASR